MGELGYQILGYWNYSFQLFGYKELPNYDHLYKGQYSSVSQN
jgi:hypothetical protein